MSGFRLITIFRTYSFFPFSKGKINFTKTSVPVKFNLAIQCGWNWGLQKWPEFTCFIWWGSCLMCDLFFRPWTSCKLIWSFCNDSAPKSSALFTSELQDRVTFFCCDRGTLHLLNVSLHASKAVWHDFLVLFVLNALWNTLWFCQLPLTPITHRNCVSENSLHDNVKLTISIYKKNKITIIQLPYTAQC